MIGSLPMTSSIDDQAQVKPMDLASAGRRALLGGLLLLPVVARTANATGNGVRLQYAQKHQIIEGFGTCITTWQSDVTAAYQREEMLRFYLETLGASALRIELWPGVSTVVCERWQDITFRDFRFDVADRRGKVTVEVATRLHSASRGKLRIIATAWSPPAWMKVNASLGNGHPQRQNFAFDFGHPPDRGEKKASHDTYVAPNRLRRDRYLHFAKLLVEWTRYFRSIGIPLYAISPTNEPRFSHWFESCVYTPDEYAELVEMIAWMFANQGEPPIPIFGPELMSWDVAGNRGYLEALARRQSAMQSLAAMASHGYVDGYENDLRRESVTAFRRLAVLYGKRTWITEGGFGGHQWPVPLHQLGASFLYALRDGGVSLLTTWQTLSRFPPDEHGLMSLRGPTKKTYMAMQFWRFIRPGMVRIGVESGGMLDAVAFEDSGSDTTVVVFFNLTKNATPASLQLIGRRLVAIDAVFITDESRDCQRVAGWHDPGSLIIPPESVATLLLKTRPVAP
jgi:glucuronoarabinoxylan endo-1,4-beta-xylanase